MLVAIMNLSEDKLNIVRTEIESTFVAHTTPNEKGAILAINKVKNYN